MAGAVASAGAATQAGVAVGVAAATAAAVSGGIAVVNTPAPVVYNSTFVPPICSDAAVEKVGYLELSIQGIPPRVLSERKWVLEEYVGQLSLVAIVLLSTKYLLPRL